MKTKSFDINTLKNMDDDSKYIASMCITDIEAIKILSVDSNDRVRNGVTQNPNVSIEILEQLSNDKVNDVRMWVASSDNSTEEILKKLSNDKYFWVRLMVSINPKTPKEVFERLLSDEELCNRNCFWGKQTPEEISEYVYVNLNIALSKMSK